MKSLTDHDYAWCSLIIVLIFWHTKVTAQEGPGIVIAHPGQDVELLCNVTPSGDQTAAWIINNGAPHTLQQLHNNILTGYSTNGNNLIIENIMMTDDRNDTEHICVTVPSTLSQPTVADIIDESDTTILYVAGIPAMVPNVTVDDRITRINGNIVILRLSWGEPFNSLDPIVNYTVSCSGDDACPLNFTTFGNGIIITNLTTMTNYTFSVVATNSIGSGEAGVVMITTPGDIIHTTSSKGITTTTTSSEGMTTTTSNDCGTCNNAAIIGAIVGVVCTVIIIMVITSIMVWIYCFRRRHHTGTSSELHKPTNDTVNPAYHTITDDYKKPVGEPISYYEEVNKPPDVKMTQNPAYAVP